MSFEGGFNAVTGYYDARDRRRLQQQQIDQSNTKLSLKLAQEGYARDGSGGVEQVEGGKAELAQQEMLLMSRRIANTEKSLMLADFDTSVQDFVNSGDAGDMQLAFDNNEKLREVWKNQGVEGVSNIDWDRDSGILERAGIPPETYDTPEDRASMNKEYFKVYNGRDYSIQSVEKLTMETGLLQRLNETKQNILLRHFAKSNSRNHALIFDRKLDSIVSSTGVSREEAIEKIIKTGVDDQVLTAWQTKVNDRAKAAGISYDEQIRKDDKPKLSNKAKMFEEDRLRNNRTVDQQIEFEAEEKRVSQLTTKQIDIAEEAKRTGKSIEDIYAQRRSDVVLKQEQASERATPQSVREAKYVDTYRDKLFKQFGSEEGFYNTDFSDAKNYRKAASLVQDIEKVGGLKLSKPDIKDFKAINKMIELGRNAQNLSEDNTGFIDSFLHDVRQFFTNQTTGVESTASYNSFKNIMGNVLYGQAFSKSEQGRFDKAFGTTKTQLAPTLVKLKVSLGQIRSQLVAIQRISSPIVSKFRLGTSMEDVNTLISNIDSGLEKLDLAFNKGAGKPARTPIDFTKLKFIIP